MNADTFLKIPIESIDCVIRTTTSPFGFSDQEDLYCGWCLHEIRLVCRTKTGVSCSDCGQTLDIAPQSFF